MGFWHARAWHEFDGGCQCICTAYALHHAYTVSTDTCRTHLREALRHGAGILRTEQHRRRSLHHTQLLACSVLEQLLLIHASRENISNMSTRKLSVAGSDDIMLEKGTHCEIHLMLLTIVIMIVWNASSAHQCRHTPYSEELTCVRQVCDQTSTICTLVCKQRNHSMGLCLIRSSTGLCLTTRRGTNLLP